MTPPNVLGAPKPTSSVRMSRMLGAPLGGTTRGAHQGLDWSAFSLVTPPNFGSGGGSCLPLMVVVAAGDPAVPLICWASEGAVDRTNDVYNGAAHWINDCFFISRDLLLFRLSSSFFVAYRLLITAHS